MNEQQKIDLLRPYLINFLNEVDNTLEYKLRILDDGCAADFEFSTLLYGILGFTPEITISAIYKNQQKFINILVLLYAGSKHLQWNGQQIINRSYLIDEQKWGEWTWHFDEFSEFSQPLNHPLPTQESLIVDNFQPVDMARNSKVLLEKYFKTKFHLTTSNQDFHEFTSSQSLGSLQIQIKIKTPLNSLGKTYLVAIYFQGKQLDYGYGEGNWIKFKLEESEKKHFFQISGFNNLKS